MDNIKSKLVAGTVEFWLTEDKLFIKGVSGQESFALRSLNGIGVYDDIETYNLAMSAYKKKWDLKKVMYGLGGLFSLSGISGAFGEDGNVAAAVVTLLLGVLMIVYAPKIHGRFGGTAPKLESTVNLMMSGGQRSFKFYKEDAGAQEVADFVSLIENTLTAYNK